MLKEQNAIHVQNVLLQGINLQLRADKTIFWPSEKLLILADSHFGKGAHFRKNGIPVPGAVMDENLAILDKALMETKAESILVIGDLFHSRNNKECGYFFDWLKEKNNLQVQLVKGNHDILPTAVYEQGNLLVHNEEFTIGPFTFRHHPPEADEIHTAYLLCGHVHPAYMLSGKGKQYLRLPCFYLGEHFALLPAFGGFTGLHNIEKLAEKDEVYLLADDRLIKA